MVEERDALKPKSQAIDVGEHALRRMLRAAVTPVLPLTGFDNEEL